MKPMTLLTSVDITVETVTKVDDLGRIVTTTTTTTHGNARYTMLGQLHGSGREWWVSDEAGTMLVKTTKRGAVEAFANVATYKAAGWAAHKDTI